ncbi:MAG: hypothetical protein CK427_11950 [Leptospira sp.]|nr:MAG: hypothetical protein CK427_11950 [Leptospira sp.]
MVPKTYPRKETKSKTFQSVQLFSSLPLDKSSIFSFRLPKTAEYWRNYARSKRHLRLQNDFHFIKLALFKIF